MTNLVNGIVDFLHDLRLLVRRNILVLYLTEQRDDFLSWCLEQARIIHGPHLKRGRFHQLFVEKLAEVGERELVIIVDDRSYQNLLKLFSVDLDGLKDWAIVTLRDLPVCWVTFEYALILQDLDPGLVVTWLECSLRASFIFLGFYHPIFLLKTLILCLKVKACQAHKLLNKLQ